MVEGHIFNLINEFTFVIIEADVKALRTVNNVSILARGLLDGILSNFTIFLLVLCGELIASLCLDPVAGPSLYILLALRVTLINCLLD